MPNILLATSEAAPLAKTGGLADVCGALPNAMRGTDCDLRLILPAYQSIKRWLDLSSCDGVPFEVPIGNRTVTGTLRVTHLPESDAQLILVDQPEYFDRPQLYTEGGVDYRDNCERFVFFSRAVLESVRLLDLETDLIHCNDWQTALVPILLENEYRSVPGYESLASLLTIHNLAYQGRFWHWDMLLTGLDWKLFNWKQLEFYGDLNLLKGGIVFANNLNTVSPRYAEEIQTPEFGCGLDGALRARSKNLSGILNGADYQTWNPETDPMIATNYNASNWQSGKAACKRQLQQDLGLPVRNETPLIGFVGRLTEQKGVDLLAEVIAGWAPNRDTQWILLGTGSPAIEQRLRELAEQFPERVAIRLEFSESLAHQIIAASDLFAMPSRFEPCGLTQFYCLKYGTVPLVHATGGLANSVVDLNSGQAESNGFVFKEFSAAACEHAFDRAVSTYDHHPEDWNSLVERGLGQDWSWSGSAERYARLYRDTIALVRQTVCV